MKKLFLMMAVATAFVACDNAANTEGDRKDSLDSAANAKKEVIDSTSEQRKEAIDSATNMQKDAIDKMDSANRKIDSVTR